MKGRVSILWIAMLLFSMIACDGSEKEDYLSIEEEIENSGNEGNHDLTALDGNSVDLKKMLDLINEVRRNGVSCKGTYYPPVAVLAWNKKLEAAALKHSSDMLNVNYFSHTSTDGRNFGDRIKEEGYDFGAAAENIAQGHPSEETVVNAWLKSQGHCANIMSPNYTEMGVGRKGMYWTQDFGRPRK